MFCTNCGDLLDDGARFCVKCGQRVVEEVAAEIKEEASETAGEVREEALETVTEAKEEAAETAGEVREEASETVTEAKEEAAETAGEVREEALQAVTEAKEEAPQTVVGARGIAAEVVQQKTKTPSKKPWILIGVAAVLVAAVVVVLANFKVVSNSVMKLCLSPEKYYAHIEKREVQEFTSDFADTYDNSISYAQISDTSLDYTIELELGEMVYEMLGSAFELEDASGLSRMGIDFLISAKENVFSGELAARLGESRLISVNAVADLEKAVIYAQVPELSDKYIGADISEAAADISEAINQYMELVEMYPEGDVLEELINRYTTIVIENVSNVTEEKETIAVGELKQKCTVLCASLSQKEVFTMLETICTTAREDETLLDMLGAFAVSTYDMEAQTAKDNVLQAIEEYLAEAESYKETAGDEEQLAMRIWVNNKGEVVGRELAISDGEIVLSYQMPQKGMELGYRMCIGSPSAMVEITGAGTRGFSKMNGEFKVQMKNGTDTLELFDVTVENLDTDKLAEGMLNVTCIIKPAKDLYEELGLGAASALFAGYELIYEAKTDWPEESVTTSLMNGEELLVRFKASAKLGSGKSVSLPAESIMIEGDEDLIAWIITMDFDRFVENLSQTGMPAELVAVIEAFVSEFNTLKSYY